MVVAAALIGEAETRNVVKTFVTMVLSWISSFFWWLRGKFVTRMVTTTVVETVRVYAFGDEYELEKVDTADDPPRMPGKYFIAIIVSNFVFISTTPITKENAVDVLSKPELSKITIDGEDYQTNTYTYYADDAIEIAESAALKKGKSGHTHHFAHSETRNGPKYGVFFNHYHPCNPYIKGTPHSFYGLPTINL